MLYIFLFQAILPAIPDIGVQTMLSAIFSEVQVQTLAQGDRRAIFTIVAHFLSQRIQGGQTETCKGWH